MAKIVTGNPWVFDAVDQAEGVASFSDNPDVINFRTDFYVQYLKLVNPTTANTTTFEVVVGAPSAPTDSDTLTGAVEVAAGESKDVWIGQHVGGVNVITLPTSGKVLVYHGTP